MANDSPHSPAPLCTCEATFEGHVAHCPHHAAADEMLEALKMFTVSICQANDTEALEAAQKAINKAEGKVL